MVSIESVVPFPRTADSNTLIMLGNMKKWKNIVTVKGNGHFDNEIDLLGSEGLEGIKVDNVRCQEFFSSTMKAYKNEVDLLPKELAVKVVKIARSCVRSSPSLLRSNQTL